MKFFISPTVLEILREHGKECELAVGVCCCLQTCNSVVNMLVKNENDKIF